MLEWLGLALLAAVGIYYAWPSSEPIKQNSGAHYTNIYVPTTYRSYETSYKTRAPAISSDESNSRRESTESFTQSTHSEEWNTSTIPDISARYNESTTLRSWETQAPMYLVSIFKPPDSYCVGVIISNNCVLTSTSCVETSKNLSVLGRDGSDEIKYDIDFVITREGQENTKHQDGLAILVLHHTFEHSKRVNLSEQRNFTENILANATWRIPEAESASKYFVVEQTAFQNDSCQDASDVDGGAIALAKLCTKFRSNEESEVCKRLQLGSPLMIDQQLIGIYTRHINCSIAVYTTVGYYIHWIEKGIQASSSKKFHVDDLSVRIYRN
ncbi:hypothetical protein QAD02_017519 [Eretmocerus hayati]|uniref:Uncharacterized protein n=1 Tax=Eretmocerus hayati TaxID=131215 RepID=A0ACC2PEI4_9HYME|nr:hypothetical protein QAD02_017519 [Eretmocerus hayati]